MRLLQALRKEAVDCTPVWFMRQAGRYMAEYREVRKHHSLLEICQKPPLAAEVTITAAEILGVDAAIIFADLLLPLEIMGIPFRFASGEGPVIERPLRSAEDVARVRTDRAGELGYVAESVAGHDNFQDGHEFIDGKGQRGPQKDILLPGTYYINPLLFKVILETAKEIKPGEVAVIVSNTGKDPSDEIRRQMARKVRERMEREEKECEAALRSAYGPPRPGEPAHVSTLWSDRYNPPQDPKLRRLFFKWFHEKYPS